MRQLAWWAVTPAVVAAIGCANLPAPGACGNGVHEPELGEDCDGSDGCSGCRLQCAVDRPCPAGGACGVDGLCSFPAGVLAYPASFVEYAPTYVRVLDHDGDGIGDVAGVGRFSVDIRYGSATADLARSDGTLTPFLAAGDPRPVLEVVPGLGTAAVLPTEAGITAYFTVLGTLLPLPTPASSFDPPATLRHATIACTASACGLVGIYVDPIGVHLFSHAFGGPPVEAPCGAMPSAPILPVAPLRVPGERDVLAVATSTAACVFDMVTGDPIASWVLAAPPTRIMRVQADADPCDELLIAAATSYRVVDPGTCGAASTDSGTDTVIAAGDLDGDGRSDRVTPLRVELTSRPGAPFSLGIIAYDAAIGDFNRDGLNDVVVIDHLARRTNVLLGLGGGELSWRPTGMVDPATSVAVADLDGDRFDDVVLSSQPEDARLVVMFGSPFGLELPVVFGYASNVTALTASARNLAGLHVADVTVVHIGDERGQGLEPNVVRYQAIGRSLAPSSPMPFDGTVGTLFGDLLAVPDTATARDGDVAVFGLDPTEGALASFWLPGRYRTGEAAIDREPFHVVDDNATGYFPEVSSDPVGRDGLAPWLEVVSIGGAPAVLAVRRAAGVGAALLFRPPDPVTQTASPSWLVDLVPLDPPAGNCDYQRQILRTRAVQFDADADTELVVITFDVLCPLEGETCRKTACEEATRAYLVDFAADGRSATSVELGLGGVVDGDYYACRDAAAIELGASGLDGEPNVGPQELALACVTRIAERDATGAPRRDPETYLPVRGQAQSGLYGFYSRSGGVLAGGLLGAIPFVGELAAGDVTGDGLDDIIVMIEGLAGVAVQCPRHDPSTCQP